VPDECQKLMEENLNKVCLGRLGQFWRHGPLQATKQRNLWLG
jgi:hypothetical protein